MPDKPPKGWVKTTLGEVCSKPQYGWTTSGVSEGDTRLLRTTDITSGAIDWETVPFCRDEPENLDHFLFKDGDIVISRAGRTKDEIERAVRADYDRCAKPCHSICQHTPSQDVSPARKP